MSLQFWFLNFADIGPLPDGVDPAFLAALPEDMRNEVLRDCRAQLERQRRAQAAAAAQQVEKHLIIKKNKIRIILQIRNFIACEIVWERKKEYLHILS